MAVTAADRRKGAVGERELAAILTRAGFPASRNARNGVSAEDIAHAIPGVWLEAKRQETARIWPWLAQAELGARLSEEVTGEPFVPVVAFRRNRSRWYAALPLEDLIHLWKRGQDGND